MAAFGVDELENLEEWVEIAEEMENLVMDHPRRYLRDMENPMEFYREDEFIRRYRFRKIIVVEILELFADDLQRVNNRGLPVPPMLQLVITLRYYATGKINE
jgi:hypothetical protein